MIVTIVLSSYPLMQHFSLRLVLWLNEYAPWNYARFLDYATDRLFLQRVGGGYRFIHRLIQEHFAFKFLEKAIKLNSRSGELFYKRALVYSRQENYQRALDDYSQAIQLNSKDPNLYWGRAINCYENLKEYQAALADYTKVIEKAPNFVEAYFYRGAAYSQLEDYQKALADYTQVIELDPNYTNAYLSRGIIYGQLENYQKAFADFTKVIEKAPDFVEAYFYRGAIYHKQGNYPTAISEYNQVIAKDEKHLPAITNTGLVKYEIGSIGEAMKQWQQAINLKPDDPEAKLALAVAFYAKGEPDRAFTIAETALKLDKGFADLEYLKENLWGERLLADAQELLSTPRIKAFLSSEQR